MYFVFEEFPATKVIFQNGKRKKKKGKTGQQSKRGGDENVGLDVPNNNETNIGDGNDNVLDENRNIEGGKDFGDDANVVGKSSDGDNGNDDNSDGFVNINGGNDSNDDGNPPASGDAVSERKKLVKTGQQSNGGGDNNVGLDVPNHNETNSGDGNNDDLDEIRKNEGGKDICDDNNVVGRTCDGDNGDGNNSDGIVNNFGDIDSNDVVNPPDSGDVVGEVNIVSDANNVGKSCDGDNGDGDNSDGIVNNIGGNDSNDVGNPPDSDDTVGERKKKGKTVQQSKGGGDNNCGLDGPNHNETNSGDGNDNVLGGNRRKE